MKIKFLLYESVLRSEEQDEGYCSHVIQQTDNTASGKYAAE